MNTLALHRRGLPARPTLRSHRSSFSPRSALAFPQPPPSGAARAVGRAAWPAAFHSALGTAVAAVLRRVLPPPRMELRIDVNRPDAGIEAELDTLYGRLHSPGDPIHRCTRLPALLPGLVFHHREADGEHYVYVEDPARARLAGYTVFNRLIEVDRRTDRHVRSPHSKYAPAYQGRGIASAVYGWGLDRGFCLVSGARQSEGAHALWRALARRRPLRWVALRARRMHDLGVSIPPARAAELDTRMILLGAGWSVARLHAQGLLHPPADAANDAIRKRA
ncbi:hypothetical protein [Thauera aromatica]|uniref:Histone acetyltransferase HPA2-like protein n=1 Tax=Thauera aromatica K172 TaxID=44139 RepID=A0A2R4BI23_THAAR|nr:hypothetical protein [Thauera aromatica]AVR86966.1 histone acetyltransferase HPA2-like protein [Thauera aromatica K172]